MLINYKLNVRFSRVVGSARRIELPERLSIVPAIDEGEFPR